MRKFFAVLASIAVVAMAAPAMAATNPFMDVPQGHWAYDAVALLASRGVVSGYPDGAFKGAQPATRYEMASVVARALTTIDAEKASKQDLELLKKLVMEFKDELDALGVKVDKIDKRVAVLEDGIGGWKIRGIFRFDAKFAGDTDNGQYYYNESGQKNDFEKERFRLFLTKQINENTSFYAQYRTGANGSGNAASGGRGDIQNMRWSHLYVDTKLPYDVNLRVGRFAVDFEDDNNLYMDNDAIFGDYRTDGFRLTKKWDTVKATAIVSRNDNWGDDYLGIDGRNSTYMNYTLDINWQPNEKFFGGLTGYWFNYDGQDNGDRDLNVYSVYAGYSFNPSIALRGIYYWQDLGDDITTYTGLSAGSTETSPKAWKLVLDVKQDLLKFTSLWVEYSQQDNTFYGLTNRYSIGGGVYDYVGRNMDISNPFGTSKWWFVYAGQKWNDKWGSFVRFATVDYDTNWLDNATEWGLGVTYQLNPAVQFELAYDQVDHGDTLSQRALDGAYGKDHVVRFRTTVNF